MGRNFMSLLHSTNLETRDKTLKGYLLTAITRKEKEDMKTQAKGAQMTLWTHT